MNSDEIITWLLDSDPAIQFQVYRDLLHEARPDLQEAIARRGWGAQLLALQQPNGHWGRGFYQPKWTSTHYSLLDLRHLCLAPKHASVLNVIRVIAQENKAPDGGIDPHRELAKSDVCINGMYLNYACWFGLEESYLESVVDFVLSQHMPDGGFNCRLNRSGAVHSSLHSTISVLEGIEEYRKNAYNYRLSDLLSAAEAAREFLLMHRLYKSDRTGEIIHPRFLRLPYPSRWYYDILRALDYFQYANIAWDERMSDAFEVLLDKRNKSNTWNVQASYAGNIHFEMEKAGQPSRWNTLRALRVLQHFDRA